MKFFEEMRIYAAKHKKLTVFYIVLRLFVMAVMVAEILNGGYYNAFLCLVTLVLFTVPSLIERRGKIDVPDALEAVVLLFIFAAEVMGEIGDYYVTFPYWDTMLHTTNGFLAAAVGLSCIDILNRHPRFAVNMSPLFVSLTAFCFSVTIGVLWEFFEFGADTLLGTDMQRSSYVGEVSSNLLNPDGKSAAETVRIESVAVNGEEWKGYIDTGLRDTMKDLIVNVIGAAAFSFFGYFYVKNSGKSRIMGHLLLTREK